MKLATSVLKKIKQSQLRFVDYEVVKTETGYTAKFMCLSDLEKKLALKEGFLIAA